MKSKAKNQFYGNAQKNAEMAMVVTQKQAKEALEAAKVKFKKVEKVVHKKIQTHPEQAMLIAATVGAVIGALAIYGVMNNAGKKNASKRANKKKASKKK